MLIYTVQCCKRITLVELYEPLNGKVAILSDPCQSLPLSIYLGCLHQTPCQQTHMESVFGDLFFHLEHNVGLWAQRHQLDWVPWFGTNNSHCSLYSCLHDSEALTCLSNHHKESSAYSFAGWSQGWICFALLRCRLLEEQLQCKMSNLPWMAQVSLILSYLAS